MNVLQHTGNERNLFFKRDRADHYCRDCFLNSEVVHSLEFQKELENPYLISGKGRNSPATRIISKKRAVQSDYTSVLL